MSTVKPGGYAAENDRVQADVKQFAQQLLADKAAGRSTTGDLDAFHAAYKADGGLNTSQADINHALGEVPGLSQADMQALANIANEPDTEPNR